MKLPAAPLLLLLLSALLPMLRPSHADDSEVLPFVQIERVSDLRALGQRARREGKVVLLEVEASDCGYCRRLEEEILKPMLRSGDYESGTLIVQLAIDGQDDIRGWNGRETTPSAIARRYGVFVTPTLLFLDADGREVAKRIIGINSLDYFGAYVDEALAEGRKRIAAQASASTGKPRE